jgi:hypothetical protein
MPSASPTTSPTPSPTPLPETSYTVEAKLGVAGFCASGFPIAAFKAALRAQLGYGTVSVTAVVDQSTLCGSRRMLGRQLDVSSTVKKVRVEYEVQLVVQAEADLVTSGLNEFSDPSTGALTAFATEFESEIVDGGVFALPAGFSLPVADVEVAVSVIVTASPTQAPTKAEVSSMKEEEGGISGAMLAGIVAAVFVVLAVIFVSLQKKPVKHVEKVYSTGDEEAPEEVAPTNPTAPGQVVQPVHPAPQEEVSLVIAPVQAPAPAPAPSPAISPARPTEITLSPTATRGPPCDLFIDGMDESDDDDDDSAVVGGSGTTWVSNPGAPSS